ncbi:hypothetical protein C8R46DRAFT_1220636 [Mycena filopes]|nr:hypothetical protein C8R46DRAFT_1220636 [Mycena filopes]
MPATHAIWWVGKADCMNPQAYPTPSHSVSWGEFEFYSTSDNLYHRVEGPIDMSDRGAFLILQKRDFHAGECPQIWEWEKHACTLAAKAAGSPDLTPSKARSPAPQSVTDDRESSPSGTSPDRSGDESTDSEAVEEPVAEAPTTPVNISKRKRSPPASTGDLPPAAKRVKRGNGSPTNPFFVSDSE